MTCTDYLLRPFASYLSSQHYNHNEDKVDMEESGCLIGYTISNWQISYDNKLIWILLTPKGQTDEKNDFDGYILYTLRWYSLEFRNIPTIPIK